MGAARSRNSAEAITNISNFIDNSTKANTNAVSKIVQETNINGCTIQLGENFDVNSSATLAQKNNQILSAKQDTNVKNNVQQQMLQQSQSKVGSLGIGFASANNSSSQLVNSTNTILNAMNSACNQYSSVDQQFNCDDTFIQAKNLKIGFNSTVEFLSNQTLNNEQVANITNDISQITSQKASATVEGIGGFLFMLLLAIAAIVYALMKPLSSGSVKVLVGSIVLVGVISVIIIMFIKEQPPFFGYENECINNSQMGRGEKDGIVPECVNIEKKKIHLSQPVMKYNYAILPSDMSQSGGNLLQMAIAAKAGQTIISGMGVNSGYNALTHKNLELSLSGLEKGKEYRTYAERILKIPMVPNPLVILKTQTEKGYAIPVNYGGIKISPQSSETDKNICTPGTVQVGDNQSAGKADLKNCPRFLKPEAFDNIDIVETNLENIVANLNIKQWTDWMNMTGSYPAGQQGYVSNKDDERTVRSLFARFVLSDLIGNIDLHYYVHPKEIVKFRDKFNNIVVGKAETILETNDKDIYLYHPYSFPGSWSNGCSGPGYIHGYAGVVNDNSTKFEQNMKNIGLYIFLGFICLIFLFLGYQWYKIKKTENNSNKKISE